MGSPLDFSRYTIDPSARAQKPTSTDSWVSTYLPPIVRGASGFSPPLWPGFLIGAGGEALAQKLEGRPEVNWTTAAGMGAVNAIPLGKTATLGKAVLKSAGLSGLGEGVYQQTETFDPSKPYYGLHQPTPEELNRIGGAGIIGGGVGGILHGIFNRGRVPPTEPPPNLPPTPTDRQLPPGRGPTVFTPEPPPGSVPPRRTAPLSRTTPPGEPPVVQLPRQEGIKVDITEPQVLPRTSRADELLKIEADKLGGGIIDEESRDTIVRRVIDQLRKEGLEEEAIKTATDYGVSLKEVGKKLPFAGKEDPQAIRDRRTNFYNILSQVDRTDPDYPDQIYALAMEYFDKDEKLGIDLFRRAIKEFRNTGRDMDARELATSLRSILKNLKIRDSGELEVTADELIPEVKADDFLIRIGGYWKEFERDLSNGKLTMADYISQKRDLINILRDHNYAEEASRFERSLDLETKGLLSKAKVPGKPQAMSTRRPPRYPFEELPDHMFNPREEGLQWADRLEDMGRIEEANRSREEWKRFAEEQPLEQLNIIKDRSPHLVAKAESIYNEKSPEKIAENLDRLRKEYESAQEELGRMYDENRTDEDIIRRNSDVIDLWTIAEAKYNRASQRILGGEIELARSGKRGLKFDVNIQHAVDELTRGYNMALPKIMVREALQNSVDAIRKVANGNITVKFGRDPNTSQTYLEIQDTGKGVTKKEIWTVLSNLHESGKTTDPTATGGKGVGKAPFMMGGTRFELETVTQIGSRKIKYSYSGTPQELMTHAEIQGELVPRTTPTGTTVRTFLKPNQSITDAGSFLNDMEKFSRDVPGTIIREDAYGNVPTSRQLVWGNRPGDNVVVKDHDLGEAKVSLIMPEGDTRARRGFLGKKILNNGIYQYDGGNHYFPGEVDDIPRNLIVDIRPNVAERTDQYPFDVTREGMKDSFERKLKDLIDNRIIFPRSQARQNRLQDLYDAISTTGNIPLASGRTFGIFDPGNRLTPDERTALENNPIIQQLSTLNDDMMDELLRVAGTPQEAAVLERVGLVLDDSVYGLMVPNPTGDKRTILFNPFMHALNKNPEDASEATVLTGMHEKNHLEPHRQANYVVPRYTRAQLSDPRVGRYLAHFLEHTGDQGGISEGHSIDFILRLGETFAKLPAERFFYHADRIRQSITDATGGYSPEFQNILRLYTERAGRPETTEDLLSATGVKQKNGKTGPSNIRGDSETVGVRATGEGSGGGGKPPKVTIPGSTSGGGGGGRGSNLPPIVIDPSRGKGKYVGKRPDEMGYIRKALAFARELQTSLDLSFPFRQGINHIHRKEFWKAFHPMFTSLGSEASYHKVMNEIRKNRFFKTADEAGVEFTDLSDDLSKREEQFRSEWAEKIPWVKKSARAYHVFGNKLRMDVFASLVDNARKAGIDVSGTNDVSKKNLRGIAALVNDSTGRGRLPHYKQGGKTVDLEAIAPLLNEVLFSPKFIMSRINMFRRAFGGLTAEALEGVGAKHRGKQLTFSGMIGEGLDPRMAKKLRREALKSMMGVGGLALVSGGISSELLGKPEAMDLRSTDFGKLKIGDTRLDFTGGFQQYVRLAAQMQQGMANIEGQIQDRDSLDTAMRFFRNKLSPVASAIADWLAGENVVGEEFGVGKAAAERITPLILQDMWELYNEDRKMTIPGGIAAGFGVGVQSYGETAGEQRPSQRRRSNQGAPAVNIPPIRTPQVEIPNF